MSTLPYTLTIGPNSQNELRARARFPAAHAGFQGHFPGNPILPGFLHVQLALDLLRAAGIPHTLRQITAGKFSRPIPPETEIQIALTVTGVNNFEARLTANDEPLSTFTLAVE
jgi:3-hydroxyacyl-[acyl-carrier-protein] dehydratase